MNLNVANSNEPNNPSKSKKFSYLRDYGILSLIVQLIMKRIVMKTLIIKIKKGNNFEGEKA